MGMTFKRTDSLEKLFEEFAIDPDKLDKKKEKTNKEIAIDEKSNSSEIKNKKN